MKNSHLKLFSGPFFLIVIFALFKFRQHHLIANHRIEMEKSMGFKIEEVSKKIGIEHVHHAVKAMPRYHNVAKWVESMGAGLTIADFNNDGFMDIILNDNQKAYGHRLYMNNQNGKFIDKTEEFQLNKKIPFKYQTRIIALDCNNDGFQDLFVLSDCPHLFKNRQGKYFEDFSKASGLQAYCNLSASIAATSFDYDKDGNLDLIYGSYFKNDPFFDDKNPDGIVPDNFNDSKNGAPIFLMKGDGLCHFKDKSELLPKVVRERGWFLDIGVGDIFQNGNQDLWFVTDYGISHPNRFVSNNLGWKDESDLVDKPTKTRNSMGFNMSDIDHKLVNNVFLPNIYRPREKVNGNLLWNYDKKNSSFIEKARGYNAHDCGWTWGSQFVDLNNDTWDDLVITNGMFGDGSTSKSYWYNLSILDASGRPFMSDIKNWPDMSSFELDGAQRDCLMINLGRARGFVNVTESTDFDQDLKNGRGVGYIDINNNGIYSLVVVNQNDTSHVYTVNPTEKFQWIGLSLKTSDNSSFSIGAKVFWKLSNGEESFKEMRPIQGNMAQNDPRFRLAFPEGIELQSLSITWLDGKNQPLDLKFLKMNQYNNVVRGGK